MPSRPDAGAEPAIAESPRPALAGRVHGALPQTQCTRCGYADCAAYADAIASNEAPINRCPPGGSEGIARLAAITGRPAQALDPAHGAEGPRGIAVIDESWCIGCTLCLDACPTDAIFGSSKRMHTVIEAYCTGCELCLPVCPVDCISLANASGERTGWSAWSDEQAREALARYELHRRRGGKAGPVHEPAAASKVESDVTHPPRPPGSDAATDGERKKAVIAAALEKARARRAGS